MDSCFEYDWECSALPKLLKDHDIVKPYLRSKYTLVKEAYKHLSCVTPSGNVPSIGMNIMTDLVLQCSNLLDFKTLKTSDCDLSYVTTLSKANIRFPFKEEECMNPERQLIRCQFLELLIRLALEKYHNKGARLS